MKFFGVKITITLLVVAVLFYWLGARYPALAHKVTPQ